MATDSYLGNAEKARLPHGLRRMVAQVLIVLTPNDRRDLPQGILWVLTEQDERFLLTARRGDHQTFASPRFGRGHHLLTLRHKAYDGLRRNFLFLGCTVDLRHRSLRQGPARARPHRPNVRLLILRGFASNGSPPLRVVHLCKNKGRRVNSKQWLKVKKRVTDLR